MKKDSLELFSLSLYLFYDDFDLSCSTVTQIILSFLSYAIKKSQDVRSVTGSRVCYHVCCHPEEDLLE